MHFYPHDDIGYGCISLTDDTSLAERFLEFCNEDKIFSILFLMKNLRVNFFLNNKIKASMTLFDECIEALSDDFSLLTEEEEKEVLNIFL